MAAHCVNYLLSTSALFVFNLHIFNLYSYLEKRFIFLIAMRLRVLMPAMHFFALFISVAFTVAML